MVQIEEVAVLASLQQRTQLGAEQLFGFEGRDLGLALIPVTVYCEGVSPDAEQALVLAGIDLDLELQFCLRINFGRELESRCIECPACSRLHLPSHDKAAA